MSPFLYFMCMSVAAPAQEPGKIPIAEDVEKDGMRFSGGLVNYLLTESHPFFGERRRSWVETSARLGAALRRGMVEIEVGALGVKTTGLDPFGSGTSAHAPGRRPRFELDKALIRLHLSGPLAVRFTVRRQEIALGSQFLIGNGVFDGFSAKRGQAVYHNPRRSFDAVRAEWHVHNLDFDSFVYRVDATWDAGGKSDGVMGGLNLSRVVADEATYSAGVFYRHSPSRADNDMALTNIRVERSIPGAPDSTPPVNWWGSSPAIAGPWYPARPRAGAGRHGWARGSRL
ncbi:MAG TPA: hypothetical protein VM120_11425 [Bryobacteraceae bacterium]|nr:hypothetical protein [Bryobacteraceae bacterium]